MKTYILERTTMLNATVWDAWAFFSNPANLAEITPPEMQFRIVSDGLPHKIHSGLTIQYKVTPLLGIGMNWVSEIQDEAAPYFFADVQKKGPYALWHHEHSFEELRNITLMTDKVTYALPFGFMGRIAHFLMVKKKLANIFDYRATAIKQFFPD